MAARRGPALLRSQVAKFDYGRRSYSGRVTDTLGDLLSRDPNRIRQASWDIISARDTALLEILRTALPAIRQATANIELGGMIQPNRAALTHALGKVQNYRTWRCWCDDYPKMRGLWQAVQCRRGRVSRTLVEADPARPSRREPPVTRYQESPRVFLSVPIALRRRRSSGACR
jgi:hypothetical protein